MLAAVVVAGWEAVDVVDWAAKGCTDKARMDAIRMGNRDEIQVEDAIV